MKIIMMMVMRVASSIPPTNTDVQYDGDTDDADAGELNDDTNNDEADCISKNILQL